MRVITRRIKVLAEREMSAHKYSHGTVAVIAGSDEYPGASVLTVGGARCGGAGYIQYADLESAPTSLVLQRFPDVVTKTLKTLEADCWVIGSGNPKLPRGFAMPDSHFLVLDAGSIPLVARSRSRFTVITPHDGEFKALGYGKPEGGRRVDAATRAAKELNAFALLKGPETVIATPEGYLRILNEGGPELATAGTGDVLAGFIGSMLASWKPSTDEEVLSVLANSVRAHAIAGKWAYKHCKSMTSVDLLEGLSRVIK